MKGRKGSFLFGQNVIRFKRNERTSIGENKSNSLRIALCDMGFEGIGLL